MKYTIRTLEHCTASTLFDVYNRSFLGSSSRALLDKEHFKLLLLENNVELELSTGAFDEKGDLVGFLLLGIGRYHNKVTAYVGGIGVVEMARSNNLSRDMFQVALPLLKNEGVEQVYLEIAHSNQIAYKIFSSIGFKVERGLINYAGDIKQFTYDGDVDVKILVDIEWELFESFWSIDPSWQNSMSAIEKLNDYVFLYGAYNKSEELIGYIAFNPHVNEIMQLAVKPECRHKGVAKALVHHIIIHHSRKVSINNIDESAHTIQKLLIELGLEKKENIKEMVLHLD